MPEENTFLLSLKVTLHCLIGCSIGELAGLMIGIQLHLSITFTILIAVILAYLVGFSFAAYALKNKGSINLVQSFKIIWFGEFVSISIMEVVMNLVDYHMGGMNVASIFASTFWIAFIYAFVAGYFATLPINYMMIRLNKKACH